MNNKRPAFFIMVDMIISVLIVSICTLTLYKGIEVINVRRHDSSDIIKLRNKITCVLTDKEKYVSDNDLSPIRTYRISGELQVDIYEISIDDELKQRYNFKNIEFGLISKGKGE